jgi:hypothetical protein
LGPQPRYRPNPLIQGFNQRHLKRLNRRVHLIHEAVSFGKATAPPSSVGKNVKLQLVNGLPQTQKNASFR